MREQWHFIHFKCSLWEVFANWSCGDNRRRRGSAPGPAHLSGPYAAGTLPHRVLGQGLRAPLTAPRGDVWQRGMGEMRVTRGAAGLGAQGATGGSPLGPGVPGGMGQHPGVSWEQAPGMAGVSENVWREV